jgi:hypothetical protein
MTKKFVDMNGTELHEGDYMRISNYMEHHVYYTRCTGITYSRESFLYFTTEKELEDSFECRSGDFSLPRVEKIEKSDYLVYMLEA